MTAPTPNVELLDRVLAVIKADFDHWDQSAWRQPAVDGCGTALCYAGWACELDGGIWAAKPDELYSEYLVARDGEPPEWHHDRVALVFVRDRAQAVLGITDAEASALFQGSNGLADLRHQVNRIKARAADLNRAASDGERQPREHPVPCQVCHRPTWEVSADCGQHTTAGAS